MGSSWGLEPSLERLVPGCSEKVSRIGPRVQLMSSVRRQKIGGVASVVAQILWDE